MSGVKFGNKIKRFKKVQDLINQREVTYCTVNLFLLLVIVIVIVIVIN